MGMPGYFDRENRVELYAAEKPSIAKVLSEHVKRDIRPGDIQVEANPDETGSFFIRWRFGRYVMSPNGDVEPKSFESVD
jgi:hypothetical protein